MASIVVKLIMDMWLQADPVESFALMLPMLCTALAQQDPIYRVRAFDLVYNLSLHAQMIEPVGSSSGGGSAGESQEGAPSVTTPSLKRGYRRMQPSIVNVADAARNRHGDLGGGYEVCIASMRCSSAAPSLCKRVFQLVCPPAACCVLYSSRLDFPEVQQRHWIVKMCISARG